MAIGRTLRDLRRRRGLTLRDLARRAKCSPGHLSLMERDRVSPTVATLMRISDSLGVSLTHFFTASAGPANHLVRPGERSTLVSRGSGARHELLKAPTNVCVLSPMVVTLNPKSRSGAGPHAHAGEEFLLVTKGRLRFRIGDREYLLEPGHSLTFPSVLPHAWWNPYSAPAEAIWVSANADAGRIAMIDHDRVDNGPRLRERTRRGFLPLRERGKAPAARTTRNGGKEDS